MTRHQCINLRFAAHGGLYAWDLRQGERTLQVRVEGPWVFNQISMAVEAALAGCGLAYVPEPLVRAALQRGQLLSVLPDWCTTFPGLHLYYPNRHQPRRRSAWCSTPCAIRRMQRIDESGA